MPRKKIDQSSPLYSFADKLKALRDEKGYTNQQLKEAIEEKLGYTFSEATLNNWLQHFAFPEYEKLVAICKTFPPYSVDYFMGVIDKPSYNLEYVEEYTGLSWEAIEHLKEIAEIYPETINDFLTSEFFDSAVDNTYLINFEKDKIKYFESYPIKYMYTFADKYKELLDQKDIPILDSRITAEDILIIKVEEVLSCIRELSDDNFCESVPAQRILQYKENFREALNKFTSSLIKEYKSYNYDRFMELYEAALEPLKDKPVLSEEILNEILIPLKKYIQENFDITNLPEH